MGLVNKSLKSKIKTTPVIGAAAIFVAKAVRFSRFSGSSSYWDQRYSNGGNSGDGSYDAWADYKARILNEFAKSNSVSTVIEWGCGDGNQLSLAAYHRYIGLDVSRTAINRCINLFASDGSKSFYFFESDLLVDNARVFRGDLAISLDVIYHLIEDNVYDAYMHRLFASSDRFVIIYSSNESLAQEAAHVRHRSFTPWVVTNRPDWQLKKILKNEVAGVVNFYIFERV